MEHMLPQANTPLTHHACMTTHPLKDQTKASSKLLQPPAGDGAPYFLLFSSLRAACAAASLAIGTRRGEQDT